MNINYWFGAIAGTLLLSATVAIAEDVRNSKVVVIPKSAEEASSATPQAERWLRIQAKGGAASQQLQQQTPAEQERAYQRLLDSYNHPIPEFFDQEVGGKIAR